MCGARMSCFHANIRAVVQCAVMGIMKMCVVPCYGCLRDVSSSFLRRFALANRHTFFVETVRLFVCALIKCRGRVHPTLKLVSVVYRLRASGCTQASKSNQATTAPAYLRLTSGPPPLFQADKRIRRTLLQRFE